MIIQHLPWLQVAVSAIAYFMIGAIWFNPNVFGKTWMKGHNITASEEDKKRMPMMMLMTLLCCFVSAICLAYFIQATYVTGWMMGAKIGLIAGCGFSGVAIAMTHMYTKKSMAMIFIDASYHVAGLAAGGAILAGWH